MKKEEISTNSLAHTKWNCKYHIVFAPKYRRKVFYEDKRLEIREIFQVDNHIICSGVAHNFDKSRVTGLGKHPNHAVSTQFILEILYDILHNHTYSLHKDKQALLSVFCAYALTIQH